MAARYNGGMSVPHLTRPARAEFRYLQQMLARPLFWAILGGLLLGAGAAYQVRQRYDVDVGGPADSLYLRNFQAPQADASGRTFRQSDAYGYLILPGIGGGVPYSVTVTLSPARATMPLTILVNGAAVLQKRLPGGWQHYTFSVDASHPAALAARDLVIEMRAPVTGSILLDRVLVGAAGPGLVVPAWSQLAYLAAFVLLLYLLLARGFYMRSEE